MCSRLSMKVNATDRQYCSRHRTVYPWRWLIVTGCGTLHGESRKGSIVYYSRQVSINGNSKLSHGNVNAGNKALEVEYTEGK